MIKLFLCKVFPTEHSRTFPDTRTKSVVDCCPIPPLWLWRRCRAFGIIFKKVQTLSSEKQKVEFHYKKCLSVIWQQKENDPNNFTIWSKPCLRGRRVATGWRRGFLRTERWHGTSCQSFSLHFRTFTHLLLSNKSLVPNKTFWNETLTLTQQNHFGQHHFKKCSWSREKSFDSTIKEFCSSKYKTKKVSLDLPPIFDLDQQQQQEREIKRKAVTG